MSKFVLPWRPELGTQSLTKELHVHTITSAVLHILYLHNKGIQFTHSLMRPPCDIVAV